MKRASIKLENYGRRRLSSTEFSWHHDYTVSDFSEGWLYDNNSEEDNALIDDLFAATRSQLQNGTEHSCFDSVLAKEIEAQLSTTLLTEEKKRVRFNDIINLIPCEANAITEDPSVFWYTAEEMETILRQARSVLEKTKELELDALDKLRDCLRGLEGFFPLLIPPEVERSNGELGLRQQKINSTQQQCQNQKFVQVILAWQNDQKGSVIGSDPTGLMVFSASCSKLSREKAIARAAQDFLDVQELWNVDKM